MAIRLLCAVLLACSMTWAQSTPANESPSTTVQPDGAGNAAQSSNAGSNPPSQTTADQGATGQSSVRIGRLVFTPGGFLDFENIYRTTNTQSNIASNFATIPFSNTPQGHVSEFRSTA